MSDSFAVDGVEVYHLLHWIEYYAAELPDKTAVKGMGKSYTYSELGLITDALAETLRSGGIGAGDVVLIEMNRDVDVFLAIIGTWKVRAAFAYIDDVTPPRQKKVIESEIPYRFTLTADVISAVSRRVQEGYRAPATGVGDLDDLAWIVVTSGTTGHPKKVRMLHRSIAVSITANTRVFGISENDVVSMLASFSFMSGLIEGFPALTRGGTVTMIPNDIRRNLSAITRFLADEHVTVSFLPANFAERVSTQGQMHPEFRLLTTGGEAAHYLKPGSFAVTTCYGMTEVSGPITYQYVDEPLSEYPVGSVFPLAKMYLLDSQMQRVEAPGAVGEICFAGQAVCAGYLDEDELNAHVFVDNPYSDDPNYARMYRTGDLARLQDDGSYLLIGRSDLMCKIRGFRIEIPEVERCAQRFGAVTRCVAKPLYDRHGSRELHLLYTSEEPVNENLLRAYMRNNLLHYKVPRFFHWVPTMPLGDNGKVDRNQLHVRGYSETDPRL